jgi:hypothetical protein
LDKHLQGFAVGHGAVTVRHLVEADGAVEDPAGFDPAFQHVGEQFLDVGPGRGGAAGDGDVAQDQVRAERPFGVLGQADPVPSPITVTVVRGPTRAVLQAWWPTQKTSDRVSSDASRAESWSTGSFTRVPWACGTPTASPWPPSTPLRP